MLFRSDRKSTRLNSSHLVISYAVFCLKKKKTQTQQNQTRTRTSHTRKHTQHRLHPTLAHGAVSKCLDVHRLLCVCSFFFFFFFKGGGPPQVPPSPPPPPSPD